MSSLIELGISVRETGRVEQRVRCPQCGKGESDDTLGVNTQSGIFNCFRCGWRGCAARTAALPSRETASPIDESVAAERKRQRLRKIWSETESLEDSYARPAHEYLSNRGLSSVLSEPPRILRFHPSLSYFEPGRPVELYPALVALLTNPAGDAVALHATYLNQDGSGKAPVRDPKKVLPVPTRGATRGGAIRLYPVCDGVLGVSEGIENALSLKALHNIPVWSSYCAGNLEVMRIPQGLRELHIAVDVDASGQGERSARALAQRVMASESPPKVLLVFPDDGGDLNDEIRARRVH
jgi:putative DNA primase/helicase